MRFVARTVSRTDRRTENPWTYLPHPLNTSFLTILSLFCIRQKSRGWKKLGFLCASNNMSPACTLPPSFRNGLAVFAQLKKFLNFENQIIQWVVVATQLSCQIAGSEHKMWLFYKPNVSTSTFGPLCIYGKGGRFKAFNSRWTGIEIMTLFGNILKNLLPSLCSIYLY